MCGEREGKKGERKKKKKAFGVFENTGQLATLLTNLTIISHLFVSPALVLDIKLMNSAFFDSQLLQCP